jgi:hypothetical protein
MIKTHMCRCALSLLKGIHQLPAPGSRVWRRPRWGQGQALRGLRPALTPAPGDAFKAVPGAGRGMVREGLGGV